MKNSRRRFVEVCVFCVGQLVAVCRVCLFVTQAVKKLERGVGDVVALIFMRDGARHDTQLTLGWVGMLEELAEKGDAGKQPFK